MSVGHDNLWQLGHSATISFSARRGPEPDPGVVRLVRGAHRHGWSVEATGYQSNSNVASAGGTSVLGKGHALGMKVNYTVPNSGIWWHSFSGIDFKDNQEALHWAPGHAAEIRAAQRGLQRLCADGHGGVWPGPVAGGRHARLVRLRQRRAAYDNKRYKASPSFLVLKGDANATYNLQAARAGVALSGQLADAALVSASRWPPAAPVPCAATCRRKRRATTASGHRRMRTPPLTYFSGLENWRLYAFADGARLRLRDPMIEQKDLFSLASVGVGSSFQFLRYLTGRVDFPTRCARAAHAQARAAHQFQPVGQLLTAQRNSTALF
jgi:hypothetical protein